MKGKNAETEVMYSQLCENYEKCNLALNNVNKERRELYEDTTRNERLLEEKDKEIEELRKCYEIERSNYDKIKARFSAMEIEYENQESIKKKEIRKYEIEKETVEETLKVTLEKLERCDEQRQDWIHRYDDEYHKTIATLSQLNNLRVEYEDLRTLKNKLESDIRELDKMNKVKIKLAKEKQEESDEI